MRALRWIVIPCLWLLLFDAAVAQEKKPLRVEDLYLMESVKAATLFPKEEKLVYERVWIDAKTKQERHSLWLVTGDREKRKPLEEAEPDGRAPVVSPDGEWIAFLSTRSAVNVKPVPYVPPYSDAGVAIWMYHVKSGKVAPLGGIGRVWGRVFHDGFYGRLAFSPDSKWLAFVADDGRERHTSAEKEYGVEILEPDQGEGYTGYGPAQVYVAELSTDGLDRGLSAAKKVKRLTTDAAWYGDPQWSPDGKSLVVVANKSKDRESVRYSINMNFDLYLIDIATKKQTQLTTNSGPDVSPRWSPDGKQIAYLSVPRNGPHRDVFNLNVVTLDGVESAVILDRHANEDRRSIAFPLPDDCWEGERHVRCRLDRGLSMLDVVCNLDKGSLDDLMMSKFGKKLQEAVKRRGELAPPPAPIYASRELSPQSVFTWKNEGLEIEGILTTPHSKIFKPPYRLIVYPHGGPHSAATTGFDFTGQLFAAHGYAVFQPNFRGSSGYGKKFLDADRFDLGGGDMRDILTGIDALAKKNMIDPKHQYVYGISYGGFMTSWLVGQTNQFRAAVAQNAVTDMNMMYGLSDLQSWTTWELGGTPWEQPERYRKHSPITYANKVKTPTLILHAQNDRRCPLPMGKAYHQALVANNVPTQLVIYPDEGHGIKQPRHREDVYRRVLAWFTKHGN